MTKEETVNALREEYLAGKSAAKREEFLAKPLERQYSAIQTWKHRRAKSGRQKEAAARGVTVAEALGQACKAVGPAAELDAPALGRIRSLVEELASLIRAELDRRRAEEIAELQKRQQEIADRLAALLADGAPGNVKTDWNENLFDF